jgi:hypothetical protein
MSIPLEYLDGIKSWQQKCLRFSDAMPTLCYVHDITWEQLCQHFPDAYSDGSLGLNENHSYTWHDQVSFVKQHQRRQPKKIIDVGGGRGEFASICKYLGIDVVSVEPHPDALAWYQKTASHFFGNDVEPVIPISGNISMALDRSTWHNVDTVVLVESLEHLEESEWGNLWSVVSSLADLKLTITNYVDWHPINIDVNIGHIKQVDNNFYDQLYRSAKSCSWRMGSHLVLNF